MQQLPETLRENVRLLGELLGETIRDHEGEERFSRIEQIRQLGKSINQSENDDSSALVELLGELNDEEILPIVRAFNQFLNLANMADQEYSASAEAEPEDGLKAMLLNFSQTYGREKLTDVIRELRIELVLTAHPTEVTRRTLIRKYDQIVNTLSDQQRGN
ncbi:phosphoenolpyruvate carboxylase, partial [Gilvimarinus agarilyticus]